MSDEDDEDDETLPSTTEELLFDFSKNTENEQKMSDLEPQRSDQVIPKISNSKEIETKEKDSESVTTIMRRIARFYSSKLSQAIKK